MCGGVTCVWRPLEAGGGGPLGTVSGWRGTRSTGSAALQAQQDNWPLVAQTVAHCCTRKQPMGAHCSPLGASSDAAPPWHTGRPLVDARDVLLAGRRSLTAARRDIDCVYTETASGGATRRLAN